MNNRERNMMGTPIKKDIQKNKGTPRNNLRNKLYKKSFFFNDN